MDVYKAIRDRKKKEAEEKKRQAREKKWKKQQQKSTTEITPEKREFYKDIIKKLYIKWKPLFDESINEAESEILKNN